MTKNKSFIGLLICFGLMFVAFSCKEKEVCPPLPCAPGVIICAEVFENTPEYLEYASISNLRIEGDYLKFTVASSGCSGSTWIVKLLAGPLAYTNPPTMTLRVHFENNEDCEAYFYREFSFNIECLQTQGGSMILNIAGQSILYEY